MELGNMIFGNSRGQAEIPREDAWHEPLSALLERAGCDSYGWPKFENDTFMVQGYDWDADCDCGADPKMEAWFEANQHGPSCYQSECRREMAAYDKRARFKEIEKRAFDDDKSPMRGFDQDVEQIEPGVTLMSFEPRRDPPMDVWREANELRSAFEDDTRKRICGARGLPYPSGCAVHCDCGRDDRADIFWREIGGHASTCRQVQPNFLYKPTGFRANWYKYPLRDSYMTPPVSLEEWCKLLAACEASISP